MSRFPDLNSKNLIALSCPPYIAPWLQLELTELGYSSQKVSETLITIDGTIEDCMRLNLMLHTGNKIFFLLKKFVALDTEKVYTEIKNLPWEELLKEDGYFSIHSEGNHPALKNTMFLNVKVKDAIVDRFRESSGKRPDSGADRTKAVIYVHWSETECSVYLDTTGESITKHGYRKIPMQAPLQESLAAAMILSTKWNRTTSFINPMCGSGTLAIEAALWATHKSPGLSRNNFAFMHVKPYDEKKFIELKKSVEERIIKNSCAIIATDISRKAIQVSRDHARNAGVDHMINFSIAPLEETSVPDGGGVVMINPPYGERIGSLTELEQLYESIGSFFKKKCGGYFGYVLSGNADLNKFIGLKTSRKIPFLNGSLECRLLEFELYEGSRKTKKQTLHGAM